jgi:hypothetical protein
MVERWNGGTNAPIIIIRSAATKDLLLPAERLAAE